MARYGTRPWRLCKRHQHDDQHAREPGFLRQLWGLSTCLIVQPPGDGGQEGRHDDPQRLGADRQAQRDYDIG